MKIPPSVREPRTKMIGSKPFHLCIHHMAGILHHPDHCRICPRASKAVPPPSTANLATELKPPCLVLRVQKRHCQGPGSSHLLGCLSSYTQPWQMYLPGQILLHYYITTSFGTYCNCQLYPQSSMSSHTVDASVNTSACYIT